ncbi:MAG: hypothetical protein KC613_13935, partial [Myxococcales bacterium]|nr:hypothetical protein [Myxococcales bacterium]
IDLNAAGDAGLGRNLNAGTISVAGAEMFDLVYDMQAMAYSLDLDNVFDVWGSGEAIAVSGSGSADFAAFRAMLSGPEDLSVQAPTPDAPLSRGGSTIRWTPGNGDMVVAELRRAGVATVVRCMSDDDGSVDVPAAALGWLPGDVNSVTLDLRRIISTEVMTANPAGTVMVTLERISNGRNIPLED